MKLDFFGILSSVIFALIILVLITAFVHTAIFTPPLSMDEIEMYDEYLRMVKDRDNLGVDWYDDKIAYYERELAGRVPLEP